MAKLPPLPEPGKEPQTFWEKILTMTPVVMTVVATVLAGLSNSEMTQSQYHRTMAAEIQSKAGDQWGFFQAKKLRALSLRNTLDILQGTVEIGPIDLGQLTAQGEKLLARTRQATTAPSVEPDASPLNLQSDLAALRDAPANAWALVKSGTTLKSIAKPHDQTVVAAVHAIAVSAPQETIDQAIAAVRNKELLEEINSANADAQALDAAMEPANQIADHIESAVSTFSQLAGHDKAFSADLRPVINDFTATRLRYVAARYDAEARDNQSTALLYEVQVRVESALSDRHRARSQKFFFGMLGAQAAVVVSSLSLAMQRKNLLWSFAAAVGLAAMAFAGYVYLFV